MITRTRPIRQPKSLAEQQSDRLKRAEEQRSLYDIKHFPCRARMANGRVQIVTISAVTLKQQRRTGQPEPARMVTNAGCNCEDACRAREAGIRRDCKHVLMVQMDLAERLVMDEDPEPVYVPDEEKAEETLRTLETARREAFDRRRSEDFPAE